MDLFVILIVLGIVGSVVGGIIKWILIFRATRAIAKSISEFQSMDANGMLRTLQYLQQTGQFSVGRQYMGSLGEGPITSEIRSMAASEGISLDF